MEKRPLNGSYHRATIAISVTLKWPLRNTSDINLATGTVRLLQNLRADANKQAISLPNIFFYPLCPFSLLSAEILARKGYYQLCKRAPRWRKHSRFARILVDRKWRFQIGKYPWLISVIVGCERDKPPLSDVDVDQCASCCDLSIRSQSEAED